MRRSSFRSGNLYKVGGLVNNSLEQLGLQQRILEYQALGKWGYVVGPQIAASTFPETVRDGILFVCCKSSTWSNELTMHKADILKRLNASVGKKVITDIRFTARGYRRVVTEARKEQESTRAKGLEAVKLQKDEEEIAYKVASISPSEELAEKIRKTIITCKQLNELKIQEGWKTCPKCSHLHNGEYKACDACR